MENIIRRHNVVIKYTGIFQPTVHFTLTHFQRVGKFADTVCYEFESLDVHFQIYAVNSWRTVVQRYKSYAIWQKTACESQENIEGAGAAEVNQAASAPL